MRAPAIWLSILILGLYSCNSDRNLIAIDSTNFEEEISVNQNLEFTLNQHLFNDSLFDKWTDEELLTITPKVAGKFKITSSDQITFSPSSGFAESEKYTVAVSESIYKKTDIRLAVKKEPVMFNTPLLDLKTANLYWSKEDATGELLLNADLLFNATVDAKKIAEALVVKHARKLQKQLRYPFIIWIRNMMIEKFCLHYQKV